MSLIELTSVLYQDQMNKISEYTINKSKRLITPSVFTGIRTISSLKAITEYENRYGRLKFIKGVTFPLESIEGLFSRYKREERLFLNNHLRISIPSTEMMYYKDEEFQKNIRKLEIPQFTNFYTNHSHSNITKPPNKKIRAFERWFDSLNDDFFPFIVETLLLETKYSSFYVPPAPPIFNSDLSLDFSIEINQQSERFKLSSDALISSEPMPLASFLNLSSYCFLNKKETERISEKIIDYLDNAKSDCIITKIFNERKTKWNGEKLTNLKTLINDIQNFCNIKEKLLIIADSLEIGQVLLYNGLSIYATPLNFQINSKISKAGYVDKSKFKIWLRHYNELRSWADFLEIVEGNNGIIPYSSNLGRNYHLNQLKNLNRNQVIKFRAQMRAESINDDCYELHNSIRQGDSRTAKIYLSNSSLGEFARHLL